ncbi:uncharacterized protein LOC133689498 [Populus nigra]|uniref:uncharacterized protein LOC133689498 n=1 Tax=Populus nigra TaxID=3691 RepID=UPI002B26BEEA|nr:uncharacterized protein LOC133689498 [Populus nigra]
MDVSSKTGLVNLSQDIEELWNEWQIRSLMLIGLLLQIILTILGERRKYTVGFGGDFLWLAYLSADSVAIFSLGILARSVANSTNPNLIPVFWAPILLVHIGGPGTISAYSMHELDKLLINHLLQLVTRVGVVGYVLFRLRENAFMLVAIPIFISGMIKYGERIWVFKRNKESDNLTQQPSAKRSCIHMLFQNLDLVNLDQTVATYDLVSGKKAEEAFQLTEIELGLKYDRLYSKVATVSWPRFILRSVTFLSSIFALVSFSIMIKSKTDYSKNDRIISYVLLSGVVCLESYSIIGHLFSDWTTIWLSSWKNGSLNLYTTRCLSCLHKDPYQNLQEWSGLINGNFQRRAINLLCKGLYWSIWIARNRLIFESKAPDWDMIFDLTFYRLAFWLKSSVRNFSYAGSDLFRNPEWNWKVDSREKVDKDLKELIFKQILHRRSRYDPSTNNILDLLGLLEERGRNVLQSKGCFDKLGWSVDDAEFSHSLLTWHIATHVCYIDDSKKNVFVNHQNCAMSRSLSNYMLYLLVQCPNMLAMELSGTRYTETRIHLHRLLLIIGNPHKENEKKWKKISMDKLDTLSFPKAQVKFFFYELLQSPSTMLKEIRDQGEEKSALLDGCMLAMSLQSLESLDGWSNEKKWEMISELWVEMLMYAASHSGWKEHADALARGGELLTHVCLLMAHLGLSKQCPPDVSKQLVDWSERLDDSPWLWV